MLITLSRRTAICQSVAEVYLTGVALLGALFIYINEMAHSHLSKNIYFFCSKNLRYTSSWKQE